MRCLAAFFLLLFPLLAPGPCAAAGSNIAVSLRDAVRLVSESDAASGGVITLGLQFHLSPGWHIYWSDPGDAGFAPWIRLDAPVTAGDLRFPPPQLLLQGPVGAYVLSGDPLLAFTASGVGSKVSGAAAWLVCSDVCVPEHAHFTLNLPGGASAEAPLFAGPMPVASPFAASLDPDGTLSVAGLTRSAVAAARFFPDPQDAIVNRADQRLRFGPAGLRLKLTPAAGFDADDGLTGVLEVTDPSGAMRALRLSAVPGMAATPLAVWLGFAFLGGLILNLMPCVFPVLAMKALALLRLPGTAGEIRREALSYTAGVLAAMLALAALLLGLRAAGAEFGWGFQFQSPVFVVLIAWTMLAIGLNLAGRFEIALPPGLSGRLAAPGSFLTGLLAVLAATPCTAPFMAGAVAAALAAPPAAAFGIFLCLGLGLAAPFLLLAGWPALARFLPRPGSWMRLLQRLLSLPIFATFLWLSWVVWREAGAAGLLCLGLGAAILVPALSLRRWRPAAGLALLTLPFLHAFQAAPSQASPWRPPGAAPYSDTRLAALRAAGTPVLIDLTAAWCVTCLLNEHTTLANAAVQASLARHHVQTLIGDWTDRDAQITRLLQANNRDGVPLYLYYPANAAPVTLPQLLTPGIVMGVLGG